jgi:hypothetical protein
VSFETRLMPSGEGVEPPPLGLELGSAGSSWGRSGRAMSVIGDAPVVTRVLEVGP